MSFAHTHVRPSPSSITWYRPKGNGGYWHQRADERFGDPSPKVDPGAFSGQRQGWKTPLPTLHNIYFICLWHVIAYLCYKTNKP